MALFIKGWQLLTTQTKSLTSLVTVYYPKNRYFFLLHIFICCIIMILVHICTFLLLLFSCLFFVKPYSCDDLKYVAETQKVRQNFFCFCWALTFLVSQRFAQRSECVTVTASEKTLHIDSLSSGKSICSIKKKKIIIIISLHVQTFPELKVKKRVFYFSLKKYLS